MVKTSSSFIPLPLFGSVFAIPAIVILYLLLGFGGMIAIITNGKIIAIVAGIVAGLYVLAKLFK